MEEFVSLRKYLLSDWAENNFTLRERRLSFPHRHWTKLSRDYVISSEGSESSGSVWTAPPDGGGPQQKAGSHQQLNERCQKCLFLQTNQCYTGSRIICIYPIIQGKHVEQLHKYNSDGKLIKTATALWPRNSLEFIMTNIFFMASCWR